MHTYIHTLPRLHQCEIVQNNNSRLQFGVSSPNGILLFRVTRWRMFNASVILSSTRHCYSKLLILCCMRILSILFLFIVRFWLPTGHACAAWPRVQTSTSCATKASQSASTLWGSQCVVQEWGQKKEPISIFTTLSPTALFSFHISPLPTPRFALVGEYVNFGVFSLYGNIWYIVTDESTHVNTCM